jgi:hypothetical protein
MTARYIAIVVVAFALFVARKDAAFAQDPAAQPAATATPAAPPVATLPDRQQQVAQQFKQLEAVLLRMAELTDDPQRAALLRKAVAQSKNQLIGEQLTEIAQLLEQDRLANALTDQGEVRVDMVKLLELLLSEDRGQNLDEEKRRLQQWIREIGNLIKDQQGLQGETEGGSETKDLSERQGKLGEKTGRMSDEIKEVEDRKRGEASPGAEPSGDSNKQPADGETPKPEEKPATEDGKPSDDAKPEKPSADEKPSDDKPADGEPTDGKPSDGKPSDGRPSDGKPSDGKPSEGEPSEGQPSEGQPSEGQPSQSQPSQGEPSETPPGDPQPAEEQQPQNPTQQRLKSAQQRMEAAQKKLKDAQRKEATEDQEAAIRELQAAKAELEKILQQLREEEMQRTLAMLEQRFRKMLAAQIDVYEATQRLDSVPTEQRTRNDEIEAGRQSRHEANIADDARRALELLKQDGTAVAFPEAIEQLIEDMDQTTTWLGEAKVGELTQALEQDIIAALEEMLAALEKAQQDLEQKQQQPGQQQQEGEPEEPPLVDSLAELKLIRSLQMWVNKRTMFYSKLLDGQGQTEEQKDIEAGLRKLAEREQRIYETTRDIAQEKNQ